jgi:hypothetical protein
MSADTERARVFEDHAIPGTWLVEKRDKSGGYEAYVLFAGPNAYQYAVDYARQVFGEFDEIRLVPMKP